MNISLPASLKSWVDEQAQKGDFGTASEYVRHLLRQARTRQIREQTDAQLIQGLDSGPPAEMTSAEWASIRRAGREQLATGRRKRK